jgi:hypothetical protein
MAKHDMNTSTMNQTRHELRFRPLLDAVRGYAFPCDAQGKVDLDALCEHTRNDYFYARALIGRVYRVPVVESRSGAAPTPAGFTSIGTGQPAGSRRPWCQHPLARFAGEGQG